MAIDRRRARALLLFAMLLAACAENGASVPVPEDRSATEHAVAERDDVDDFFAIMRLCEETLMRSPYAEDFFDVVMSALVLEIEAPYDEMATLVVSLDPAGFVETLELKSVADASIESAFQRLVEKPPSFPRAPFDVRTCLGTERFPFFVKVFQKYRCLAQEEHRAYRHEAERALYQLLYSPRYSSPPGRGWVRISVELDSKGRVGELQFPGRSDALAIAKLRAAFRELGALPPPPDFSRCFAKKPITLRLEVQGE